MKNSEDVFKNLSGSLFRYAIESTNERNNSAVFRLLLVLIGIFSFIGVEAVKVIYRSNFGKNGLSLFRAILSSILFAVIAYLSIIASNGNFDSLSKLGSKPTFQVTAIFYGFLSLYILVKSFYQKLKPNENIHPNYRGDSTILGFLMKSSLSQASVQNFAEPLSMLALGIFFSAVNFLWGLPLVFCAISVWLHLLMESFMGLSSIRDTLAEKGYAQSKEGSFSEANF